MTPNVPSATWQPAATVIARVETERAESSPAVAAAFGGLPQGTREPRPEEALAADRDENRVARRRYPRKREVALSMGKTLCGSEGCRRIEGHGGRHYRPRTAESNRGGASRGPDTKTGSTVRITLTVPLEQLLAIAIVEAVETG